MLDPCINRTCEHLAAVHDIYEPGDPYPTCCADGCRCGQPGEAELYRQADGTITVVRADPVIRVGPAILDQLARREPWAWDGETLTLDTAGEHRYQCLRPDPANERVSVFGRVKS